MAQEDLKFSCLEDSHLGQLTPDDVHLFYYDIGFDSEMGYSFIYNWNNDIENYIKRNNITIDTSEAAYIPTDYSENTIIFTIGDEDEGNKAVAFFRHLRNSFAHYNIASMGNYYCIKDFRTDGKTVTMIGKIYRHLFIGLIELFFNQKAKVEEEMNKQYYPEI